MNRLRASLERRKRLTRGTWVPIDDAVRAWTNTPAGRTSFAERLRAAFADFREEDHPREPDGEFAPKGEGATGTAQLEPPAQTPPEAPKGPQAPAGKARDPRLPAIGSTIERPYKGDTLRLEVATDGNGNDLFRLGGIDYTSLSRAASAATGQASINGFLFWGLIPGKPAPKAAAPAKPAGKPAKAPKAKATRKAKAAPKGARKPAGKASKADQPKARAKRIHKRLKGLEDALGSIIAPVE